MLPTAPFLQGRGWNCCAIHGDMSQEARTRAFHAFKDGTIPLLIATDVVSQRNSFINDWACPVVAWAFFAFILNMPLSPTLRCLANTPSSRVAGRPRARYP